MSTGEFFDDYDDATLKKLEIFRKYAEKWLPVFLAANAPAAKRVCLFEFFAGPGQDRRGIPGSPLILMDELRKCHRTPAGRSVSVEVHFSDKKRQNISELLANMDRKGFVLPAGSRVDHMEFTEAFDRARPILRDRHTAKLVFLDQFGVGLITPEVFSELVAAPMCDFLFFISSSILHRFRDHPAIKQDVGPVSDYRSIHRVVLDYYRQLLPDGTDYFLAPFSFKKGSNIYGLIFGSGHLLGIDKFLRVAWKQDEATGEANFDIDREGLRDDPNLLLGFMDDRPKKVRAFEEQLEAALRDERLRSELDLLRMCLEAGFLGKHAEPTLRKLKNEGVLQCDFRVPQVTRRATPRPIVYVRQLKA